MAQHKKFPNAYYAVFRFHRVEGKRRHKRKHKEILVLMLVLALECAKSVFTVKSKGSYHNAYARACIASACVARDKQAFQRGDIKRMTSKTQNPQDVLSLMQT